MRIGAIIPVYNRENYLGAFLEMMTSHGIDCFVTLSDKPWTHGGNQEDLEPDKSELIITKFFPETKIKRGTFSHHRDSLQYSWAMDKEYDRIITFDCDMFVTNEDWPKMIEFIEQDYDVFRVNFETMIIEYYYDYRYGSAAIPGGCPPIIAIRPPTGLDTITMASSGHDIIWDTQGPKIHHFRWAKPNGSGKHFCNEPTSNFHNYNPAPQEIVDLINKWKEIVKTL